MRQVRLTPTRGMLLALLATGVAARPRVADASCNIIPSALPTFRGALASTDRPFARPGDWIRVIHNAACHGNATGFLGTTAQQVVTIVFEPPAGGPRNVVALSTNCAAVDTATCAALPTVDTATCLPVNGLGQPVALERIDDTLLRFRFPDTDHLVLGASDDITLAGPATIAVTALNEPLPCGLASSSCAGQTGLAACVDAFLAGESTCDTTPDATFPHFTALPPPNNYQAICTNPVPPCTGGVDDVRFTVDTAGNLLLPMDWRGILVNRDAVPVARLLRGSSTVEAYEGRGAPILIPDLTVLASYSPEGVKLPPLFDPQRNPNDTATTTFFGSADAAETVLRIARHNASHKQCTGGGPNDGLPCTQPTHCPGGACTAPRCVGGMNAGSGCTIDADCPGGECGPGLFDFTSRLALDAGPVLLRLGSCIGGTNALGNCTSNADCPGGQCGSFTVAALDPVPLEGLNQTEELSAFVMEEAIENQQLNDDDDETDHVVKLVDRETGLTQPIGTSATEGRAVVRVRQSRFSFAALAIAGDVLAFLESEAAEGNSDANADGDVFDPILRVFSLGGGEVTAGLVPPRVVDAAPLVSNRAIAISGNHLFYRRPESGQAARATERVSVVTGGGQVSGFSDAPALSADGQFVAFRGFASDVVPGTINLPQIFVRDRVANTTQLVSVATGGAQGTWHSDDPSISADGRYVSFGSRSALVPGDTNDHQDIFVRDRLLNTTERASVSTAGVQANSFSSESTISQDGRYVAFASTATNLVPGDTTGNYDLFLRDRQMGTTEEMTVAIAGDANGDTLEVGPQAISADGRFVTFASDASNLVPGDTNLSRDAFVRDRLSAVTERVSVSSTGSQANGSSYASVISADGRFVAFWSEAGDLVAGDTNGVGDVFVHDRVTKTTERVSVTTGGQQVDDYSASPSISGDGRLVTFYSQANNLVPDDMNPGRDIFVHDRLTGTTARVNVAAAGGDANADSDTFPCVSADGRHIAFATFASNLIANDTNDDFDVFVRGPDATDPLGVDAALFPDGKLDDTVLEVLDLSTAATTTLCPADAVAVADGKAAFLRPEVAAGGSAACPAGSLNADGDSSDLVVHRWLGGNPESLGRAATAIAMSDTRIAALVSECGQNGMELDGCSSGGTDLNGDGDAADAVAQVHSVSGSGWTNTGLAADAVAAAGDIVAFTTPEAAQGGTSLNGDGDPFDRVVQVFDAGSVQMTNVGEAAEEVVLGDTGLVAFRTREASEGGQFLNDDGDALDGVLQIYDPATHMLVNSQQAVTPCALEACDPRVPYRVLNDTVRFLTFECEQGGPVMVGCPAGGTDLNGDGDAGDLVLQVLNVRQACHNWSAAGACHTLAAVSAGICTDTAEACASDANCAAGSCFVPPGGCIHDLATACDPTQAPACPTGQFCQPILGMPGSGTCSQVEGPCRSTSDCTAPDVCFEGDQAFNRLAEPMRKHNGGAAAFTSAGRCIEDFGTSCTLSTDCPAGEFCTGATCHRDHGVCRTTAECPPAAICEKGLTTVTVDDADGDELPDPFDNCPKVPNILQIDTDSDGVGDACDSQSGCIPVTIDPRANVTVKTRDDAGRLSAKLVLPLAAYDGTESVTVSLVDTVGAIAGQNVGPLPPQGSMGTAWRYKVRGDGLFKVQLKNVGPGMFRAVIKAKKWFPAAAATETAANTELRVQVGGVCFSHVATRKVDDPQP